MVNLFQGKTEQLSSDLITMNASDFKKLSNKNLAPKIRELGWKGSGFHFYQQNPNHVVNVFGLQGSWSGGSVCCETAIHFDFIPDLARQEIDISKTTYASCIIRRRLNPKGVGDYHWTFEDKEEDNIKSLDEIWEAFKIHGMTFYDDFANFPFPFDTVQPQDLRLNENYRILNKYYVSNQIDLAWLLKKINIFIGREQKAQEFSEIGLEKALGNAKRMLHQFKSKSAQKEIEKYIELSRERFNA